MVVAGQIVLDGESRQFLFFCIEKMQLLVFIC